MINFKELQFSSSTPNLAIRVPPNLDHRHPFKPAMLLIASGKKVYSKPSQFISTTVGMPLTYETATLQLGNSNRDILLFLPQPGSLNYQLHVLLIMVELEWEKETPPVTKYHTSPSPQAKSAIRRGKYEDQGQQWLHTLSLHWGKRPDWPWRKAEHSRLKCNLKLQVQ